MKNKAKIFKFVDPMVQGMFFVLIAYSFNFISLHMLYLSAIMCWQLISWSTNFFIHSKTKLKKERLFYFLSVIIFIVLFIFFKKHAEDINFAYFTKHVYFSIPFYEFLFISSESLLALWYFLICVREIKGTLKKFSHSNN